MNRYIFIILIAIFFSGNGYSDDDCLEKGLISFEVVLADIYEEMGRPEMTVEIAEKMDREIFVRPFDKKPAFYPHVNISWGSYKNTITAIVSCEEYGAPVARRVIWRPGQDLEYIEMDAVLVE